MIALSFFDQGSAIEQNQQTCSSTVRDPGDDTYMYSTVEESS